MMTERAIVQYVRYGAALLAAVAVAQGWYGAGAFIGLVAIIGDASHPAA